MTQQLSEAGSRCASRDTIVMINILIIVLNIRFGLEPLRYSYRLLYCTVVYQTRDCHEATVHIAQNDIIVLA